MFSAPCVLGKIEIKALPLNNLENNVIGASWKCTTQSWMTLSKSSVCAIMLRLPLKNKNKMNNLKTIRIENRIKRA